jgi:hypothetical protein
MTCLCPTDPAGRQVGHAAASGSSGRSVDAYVVHIQALVACCRVLKRWDHGGPRCRQCWVVLERRRVPSADAALRAADCRHGETVPPRSSWVGQRASPAMSRAAGGNTPFGIALTSSHPSTLARAPADGPRPFVPAVRRRSQDSALEPDEQDLLQRLPLGASERRVSPASLPTSCPRGCTACW